MRPLSVSRWLPLLLPQTLSLPVDLETVTRKALCSVPLCLGQGGLPRQSSILLGIDWEWDGGGRGAIFLRRQSRRACVRLCSSSPKPVLMRRFLVLYDRTSALFPLPDRVRAWAVQGPAFVRARLGVFHPLSCMCSGNAGLTPVSFAPSTLVSGCGGDIPPTPAEGKDTCFCLAAVFGNRDLCLCIAITRRCTEQLIS